ncbi:aspartic peptidase A1 family protein [Babesia gibsoni]|uniref:Aspartic peptidase A1 family protein n=1 Tax=Babesia gibsoni TaxID=33632 RepID=A0AAD8PE70_BABGI|nr:aspartic peptidase A1 family protein [Babesia gibsoni]
MVWRWLELAIILQACLVINGCLSLESEAEFHVRHESRNGSYSHSGSLSGVYEGPAPKKIIPLIAIHQDSTHLSQPDYHISTVYLSSDSDPVKTHKENWENVAKGKIHYVYSGGGPGGSLGVDPQLVERHNNRIQNGETSQDVEESSCGSACNGITRSAEVYPHPPRNACLTLTNLRHTTHVIHAYVGMPPQEFMPMLDTGSSNTWVVHEKCMYPGCHNAMKYDPSRSMTFQKPAHGKSVVGVKFVSGVVLGDLGYENFTIGDVTVEHQAFAMLREIPDKKTNAILESTNFSGMIGMAFPDLMCTKSRPLYERYLEALDATPVFSFYFSNWARNSAVMFGGADHNFHKGKIQMLPVVGKYYWQVNLREVWIGDRKVCCDGPAYAIFDTGTMFNSMPHSAFLHLLDMYGFTKCSKLPTAEQLSNLPTIRYVFDNDVQATLEPAQYTFIAEDQCKPAYMQINVNVEDGEAYVLGSMGFMPNYYTVYQGGEQPAVGIAPADHERAGKFMSKQKL